MQLLLLISSKVDNFAKNTFTLENMSQSSGWNFFHPRNSRTYVHYKMSPQPTSTERWVVNGWNLNLGWTNKPWFQDAIGFKKPIIRRVTWGSEGACLCNTNQQTAKKAQPLGFCKRSPRKHTCTKRQSTIQPIHTARRDISVSRLW